MYKLLKSLLFLPLSIWMTGMRMLSGFLSERSPLRFQDSPAQENSLSHSPMHLPDHLQQPAVMNRSSLDTSRFMVLGEGLAAGTGDFTISAETQVWSFPAQMARQMSAEFPQRLIQSPGLGNFAGFASLPVRVPAPMQSTVLEKLPPGPVFNLAVPEFRLNDALELRPRQPLIHRNNAKQTAANLIWGLLPIAQGKHRELPTQLEYAIQNSPSFTIVELGFYEILEAAIHGDSRLLPQPNSFLSNYHQLLAQLKRCGTDVLMLNVPDPLDTAHFATLDSAAKLLKVETSFLAGTYSINPEDRLTVTGFNEIAYQLFARSIQRLPRGTFVSAAAARKISDCVAQINAGLASLASEYGMLLFDLAALFRRIAEQGCRAGARNLNSEYLGGFYSLNGYYPGQTGQAVIANEIIEFLNHSCGTAFPLIDLSAVMDSDPVAAYRQPGGSSWSAADLDDLPVYDSRVSYELSTELTRPHHHHVHRSSDWEPLPEETAPSLPLQLPPELEQVLPLNTAASYFGDGIGAVNARDPKGIQWGTTGNWLFGGLAMVDSHLHGSIRIRFTPPVNNLTQFQIDFMGGFTGDDSVLVAPQFFKMAFQNNRVDEPSGAVSSGTLNLATGEVSNLAIYARYRSNALLALLATNPNFPTQPVFPGQYGSAAAKFESRPDGKLDFSFYGSTYAPLGKDIRWPLNFVGPSGEFATVPAAGMVMHPHLSLSTKEPAPQGKEECPEVPFNTLQEFTLFTHNSAFGDAFHLNAPHLGGPAKGRSHLLGRLQIQFGPRCGNSVPFAVWALPAGGIMTPMGVSPITEVFPGRLSPGPQGFNENLRFPLRTYPLDDLSIISDPFDISVGAIDLSTGRTLNDLLHRAFISQDLIFALLRVEPRTPKDSFFFRGPALLIRDDHSQNVFRFQGIVHILYPDGFLFPHPDFATAFVVGGDSALDPFLWFHAIQTNGKSGTIKEGGAQRIRSSTGDEFSYRYRLSNDPATENVSFEYENHTQQGTFSMHSLAWIDFSNSGTTVEDSDSDTVSFTGFGIWSKDGVRTLQQVAAQISMSPEKPYVGIQIASGDVSNANTKPPIEQTALP
jgi:hypothetical protein